MSYGDDYQSGPRRVPNTPDLAVRPPTGVVSYPLILVEGEEKAGKTVQSLLLSASPKVGRTFVLELGENAVDEYATLGPFEVLVHDGTFASILGQVRAAMAVPSDPEKPNAIIIDTGTGLWSLLKKWTDGRARNSRKNKALLQQDPDAEIDPTMNLWNDAKDRWRLIMDDLRAWPGIAVVIARGKEVAKVQDGQPVAGQTEYSVEAEKTLTSDVTAWVRMKRPHVATLVAVRSLLVQVPADGLVLPEGNPLEYLVFDILGAGGFGPSSVVPLQVGVNRTQAKGRILTAVQAAHPGLSVEEAQAEARSFWEAEFPENPAEVAEARLAAAITRIGKGDPPKPPGGQEADPPGPGATEPAEEPQSTPEAAPAEQTAGEAPVHELQQPAETWAQFEARIGKAQKRDLVPALVDANLPTSGKVDEMRQRLLDHFAPWFADAPTAEKAAETVAQAFEGAQEESAEPEAAPLPDGWAEARCVCGEPFIFEKGNWTATATHRVSDLDGDHKPEEPF